MEPPRHLLRRFFAYAIDVALAWLIVALAMAVFLDDPFNGKLDAPKDTYRIGVGMHSGTFKPPVYIISRTCGRPVDLLPALRDYVAPAKIIKAEACFDRNYGLPVSGIATLTLVGAQEAGDMAGKVITVPLTVETGHRFADALAFFTFLAASILGLKIFGTTVGKKIMGLRVVGPGPIPAFRRELVRNIPHFLTVPTFLVLNLIVDTMPLVPPVVQGVAVSLEVLSIAAVLLLYGYPLLRWRGEFFHDRWLGLSVVRARDVTASDSGPG